MAILKPGVFATSLNGSSANAVFVRTRNGIVVRDRIVPHDPRTPAQIATRRRLQQVGAAWLGLSLEQAQAWRDYAESLQRVDLDTGALIGPRAQTLFSKLSLKFLQANPTAEIPLTPPDSAFAGDGIGVMVGAFGLTMDDFRLTIGEGEKRKTKNEKRNGEIGSELQAGFRSANGQRLTANDPETTSDERRSGAGARTGSPPPTPSSLTNHNEEGARKPILPPSKVQNPKTEIETGIRFTATGPNSAGVVTELLVQPLASIHRAAYRDKYRPVAFFAFEGESYEAPLPPGPYTTAYRFIRAATGQESALFECGKVVVSA